MTGLRYGGLDFADYDARLHAAADEFRGILKQVSPDALVPSCPGWTVHGLTEHLGRVHQMVHQVVASGAPPEHGALSDLPDGIDPDAWYAECLGTMIESLESVAPGRPCWTHDPGFGLVGYWWRRQAHETSLHLVDLRLAAGLPPNYDSELAADGVTEVLDVWLPALRRRADLLPDLPAPVLLACTDRPERWLLEPVESGIRVTGPVVDASISAGSEIHGSAMALLLALWKREVDGVHTSGEPATRMLASTLTP